LAADEDRSVAETITPEVAKAVNRFWQARGEGKSVSIDDCLETLPGAPGRDELRKSAIQTIAQQASKASSSGSGGPMGPADFAATMASVPEHTLAGALQSGGPLPAIEGYDLVASLGRGGMGAVFEGYQQSTGRRVAIKFMLDAMGTSEANRKRFEREVEVVARLQHPGIVSVIDSGVKRGRYFYVMDFVPGRPMDAVLAPGKCPVRDALELIAHVCDAVDYAHQRGILHRDLKPSNIIVDAKGMPHLLDFGLAKVFDPEAGDGGTHGKLGLTVSGPGQLMGTVAYMAPEQAQGKHDETSVRTDVYSLGAIAYELVTGELPSKTTGSLGEVLHRIVEVDPPAPSTERKGAGISRDLDAVLLKALEKAPAARYATAGEFAADIRRALAGEPVIARRVGAAGRTWRWMGRNRAISIISAAAVATLLGVSTLLIARIILESANTARALVLATENFNRMRSMLETVDPDKSPGLTVLELMDSAAKGLDDQPPKQDLAEAQIREVLGSVYRKFGEYEKARALLTRTLEIREKHAAGRDDAALADALHNLAAVLWWDGDYDRADPLYVRSLEMRRRLFTGDNTATAMSLTHLAGNRLRLGKLDDARSFYEDALAMRRRLAKNGESEDVAGALNNLARYYLEADRPAKAEELFRQSLAMIQKLRGEVSNGTATALQNIGDCMVRRSEAADVAGDPGGAKSAAAGAKEAYERALSIRNTMYPKGNNLVAATLSGLARAELKLGDVTRAGTLAQQSVDMYTGMYGKTPRAEHPDRADGLWTLGLAQMASGEPREAALQFEKALAIAEKARPRPEALVTRLRSDLGLALATSERPEVGEAQLLHALDEAKARHRENSTETVLAARKLVEFYTLRGEAAKALPYRGLARLPN
jgi:tetratricopeptide (TPR) repeat protein